MTTPNNSHDEDLRYLVEYGKSEWVGLSSVTAVAGATAGKGATVDDLTAAMMTILGALIDQGVVPGDLTEQPPGFQPWSGTKADRLSRIASDIHALGRLPETGEIAWLHAPAEQ